MFFIPCGNHAHIVGGSVAKILMSTLDYGWVERCSDVASCGTSFFQDKYFLCVIFVIVFCLMNCDEHVECFDECIFFLYILHVYASVYVLSSMHSILSLCSTLHL